MEAVAVDATEGDGWEDTLKDDGIELHPLYH